MTGPKTGSRSLRIVNCGDFCADLSYISVNLGTSQINLPQLLNWLNLRGLQGFLPSVQQVRFFVRNGLRNQRSIYSPQHSPPAQKHDVAGLTDLH
jgi:hypothetical protein